MTPRYAYLCYDEIHRTAESIYGSLMARIRIRLTLEAAC